MRICIAVGLCLGFCTSPVCAANKSDAKSRLNDPASNSIDISAILAAHDTPHDKTKSADKSAVSGGPLTLKAPTLVNSLSTQPAPSGGSAPSPAKPSSVASPAQTASVPSLSGLAAPQGLPQGLPMNSNDLKLYEQAFSSVNNGDFEGISDTLSAVQDHSLEGYVHYYALFHANRVATYGELTDWLDHYGDLPMAMKVWGLAKRRKPQDAPDPAFPVITTSSSATSSAAPLPPRNLTPKSARSAYNDGKLEEAIVLGNKVGDRWVAGLAAWRLERFEDALTYFDYVAHDPSQNAWVQSAGAYWAGRSLTRLNRAEEANVYFRLAATYPFTFYGLIAEQRLGVESAVSLARKGKAPAFSPVQRLNFNIHLQSDLSWTRTDPVAHRVNALMALDRKADAREEIMVAMQRAADSGTRDRWLAFGLANGLDMNTTRTVDVSFDSSAYALPAYKPEGGFHIDRALVLALARKESKFQASAKSFSGAYGLMQLMPSTAAVITGDKDFTAHPERLLKPETNIRVGEAYIQKLLDTGIVDGDLIKAVAAYNGGPRPVQQTNQALGKQADSLLFMESIPVSQTRAYAEEVTASYWIYKKLMGKTSQTLTEAAGDTPHIRMDLDRPAPKPGAHNSGSDAADN